MLDPYIVSKIFSIAGKPYVPYKPFVQPFFSVDDPHTIVLKTARQVSKTTTCVIHTVLNTFFFQGFRTLIVTPLERISQRTSIMFVKEFFFQALKSGLFNVKLEKKESFLYTLSNGSSIILSYAHLDADRTRGIPADKVHIDEIQDIQHKFLPVITAAASASNYRQYLYSGTPKTFNNTMQYVWSQSSQAEWTIKCVHCGYWNIAALEHDLLNMLGPVRDDISYENPATVCAKCGKPIHPDTGMWVHAFPDRRWYSAGYHVPQVIIKRHYADPVNWRILKSYQENPAQAAYADFLREILGEASDIAAKLVTLEDLRKVATLEDRYDLERVRRTCGRYRMRVLGIDWGGGGEGGNYTTLALVCMRADGQVEIPWGESLPNPHDHAGEALKILEFAQKFDVHFIAHDYSGAGSLRETMLIQSGFPTNKILPFRYVSTGLGGMAVRKVPPLSWHPRTCYHIDPSKCMLLVTGAIKLQQLRFFALDYVDDANPGLLIHFLALAQEMKEYGITKRFRIICEPGYRDEFAQATMLGCLTIWSIHNVWPSFSLPMLAGEDLDTF